MGPLVIVVLVGLTLVITARSLRSTLTDRHSLEEHHRALDTLGGVTHQQEGATPLPSDLPGARAHVRIVGTQAAQPAPRRTTPQPTRRRGAAPRSVIPPAVPRSTEVRQEADRTPAARGEPEPTLTSPVADDNVAPAAHPELEPVPSRPVPDPDTARPVHRPLELAPAPTPPPAPPEPASSLVVGSVAPISRSGPPTHRRRRALAPAGAAAAAAAVVILAGVELSAVFGHSQGNHHPTPALAVPAATVPAPTTTATTTVPAVLVSSDNQGAHYNVVSSVSIELVPSSPCWVEIRTASATGPLMFQGVLRPGDHRPIPATVPVWLRLGNPPGVAVVVNGTPLQPPGQPSSQPYNLTFAPATNG